MGGRWCGMVIGYPANRVGNSSGYLKAGGMAMLINQKERSGPGRELCRSFFSRLTLALDGTSLTLTPASCFFRLLGISRISNAPSSRSGSVIQASTFLTRPVFSAIEAKSTYRGRIHVQLLLGLVADRAFGSWKLSMTAPIRPSKHPLAVVKVERARYRAHSNTGDPCLPSSSVSPSLMQVRSKYATTVGMSSY